MATAAPVAKEQRVLFSSREASFTVREVMDAAHFRGELQPFWVQLLIRVQAEQRARETAAEVDSAAVDAAAVAFRYQYDLITAEETEHWLETRGLTLGEFGDYFARVLWAENAAARAEPNETSYEEAPDDLRELLVVDLILGGELDRMASRLAWRVAAFAATEEGEKAEGLDEMSAREAAYKSRCTRVLTPETRQRELASLRMPLTRFEVEMIEFESHDAAKEAFLCVRDDGMSMEEVAREGRYPFHHTEMVLEQISEDLQQRFLSLKPGSLLDPTPREDGFLLTRILDKREPKLEDADVRARVEQQILERHFSDLSSGRIQWRIRAASSAE